MFTVPGIPQWSTSYFAGFRPIWELIGWRDAMGAFTRLEVRMPIAHAVVEVSALEAYPAITFVLVKGRGGRASAADREALSTALSRTGVEFAIV